MSEKTYLELQADAKILGIKANLPQEELIVAIDKATSPKTVAALRKELNDINAHTCETVGIHAEAVKDLNETIANLQRQIESGPVPPTDEKVTQLMDLFEASMADKEVHTSPYKTGYRNGLATASNLFTRGKPAIEMLKPIDDALPGAPTPLSGRQRSIKELSRYVAKKGGLRTGLSKADVERADELLKILKMKAGDYNIPKE